METEFEWDVAKNWRNIAKHGFDFNDTEEIFRQPVLVREDHRKDYGEERWNAIGLLQGKNAFRHFYVPKRKAADPFNKEGQ